MDRPRGPRRETGKGPARRPFAGREESASIPRSGARRREEGGPVFQQVLRQAGPYLNASWTLTAALLLGLALGWWLDRKLGTEPWLMLLGVLLGIVVGMYEIARVAFPPRGEE